MYIVSLNKKTHGFYKAQNIIIFSGFCAGQYCRGKHHTIFHREFLGDWKVSESIFALFDQIGKCQNWKADTYQF